MQLVYEKEKRLRMMMKMHGLGDNAYWVVMYAWFIMLYCAYLLVFMLFGSVIRLSMFRKNNYGEWRAGGCAGGSSSTVVWRVARG
jgi:hypothetical protein